MHKQKLRSGVSVVVGVLLVFLLGQALGTQAAAIWTSVPIEPRQATTFDLLSPGYSQTVPSGNVVTFTHVLTNVSDITDSFVLTTTSAQGWPVELHGPTEALTLPVQLEAGFTATILLQVAVPSGIISGTFDTTILTATSQTSPTLTSESIDTTIIQGPIWYTYLPLVLLHWPPIPDTPVLNAITNAGDDTYYVSWNAPERADSYTLEESLTDGFSNPTVRYSGSDLSWLAFAKPYGTYYYRVKATNAWGDSAWSNVQSANVPVPAPGIIQGQITYQGNPISGIPVTLFLWNNPTTYSRFRTATTQANGVYQFLDVPPLGTNYYYRVMYENLNQATAYVRGCQGTPIFNYVGVTAQSGNFEISDIKLLSPAASATISPPYVFQWTKRATQSDDYKLYISQSSYTFDSGSLGYGGQYTLNSLAGTSLFAGTSSTWRIGVQLPDGSGCSSREGRTVILSAVGQ